MTATGIEIVKSSKPFTALDCAIAIALVAVAAVCVALVYALPAAVVTVSVDGKIESVPLDTDRTIELEHLTVHISGGEVWVTDADCPDKTCVHTGRIARAGQSIVCLPNGIVITIGGDGDLSWELGR